MPGVDGPESLAQRRRPVVAQTTGGAIVRDTRGRWQVRRYTFLSILRIAVCGSLSVVSMAVLAVALYAEEVFPSGDTRSSLIALTSVLVAVFLAIAILPPRRLTAIRGASEVNTHTRLWETGGLVTGGSAHDITSLTAALSERPSILWLASANGQYAVDCASTVTNRLGIPTIVICAWGGGTAATEIEKSWLAIHQLPRSRSTPLAFDGVAIIRSEGHLACESLASIDRWLMGSRERTAIVINAGGCADQSSLDSATDALRASSLELRHAPDEPGGPEHGLALKTIMESSVDSDASNRSVAMVKAVTAMRERAVEPTHMFAAPIICSRFRDMVGLVARLIRNRWPFFSSILALLALPVLLAILSGSADGMSGYVVQALSLVVGTPVLLFLLCHGTYAITGRRPGVGVSLALAASYATGSFLIWGPEATPAILFGAVIFGALCRLGGSAELGRTLIRHQGRLAVAGCVTWLWLLVVDTSFWAALAGAVAFMAARRPAFVAVSPLIFSAMVGVDLAMEVYDSSILGLPLDPAFTAAQLMPGFAPPTPVQNAAKYIAMCALLVGAVLSAVICVACRLMDAHADVTARSAAAVQVLGMVAASLALYVDIGRGRTRFELYLSGLSGIGACLFALGLCVCMFGPFNLLRLRSLEESSVTVVLIGISVVASGGAGTWMPSVVCVWLALGIGLALLARQNFHLGAQVGWRSLLWLRAPARLAAACLICIMLIDGVAYAIFNLQYGAFQAIDAQATAYLLLPAVSVAVAIPAVLAVLRFVPSVRFGLVPETPVRVGRHILAWGLLAVLFVFLTGSARRHFFEDHLYGAALLALVAAPLVPSLARRYGPSLRDSGVFVACLLLITQAGVFGFSVALGALAIGPPQSYFERRFKMVDREAFVQAALVMLVLLALSVASNAFGPWSLGTLASLVPGALLLSPIALLVATAGAATIPTSISVGLVLSMRLRRLYRMVVCVGGVPLAVGAVIASVFGTSEWGVVLGTTSALIALQVVLLWYDLAPMALAHQLRCEPVRDVHANLAASTRVLRNLEVGQHVTFTGPADVLGANTSSYIGR